MALNGKIGLGYIIAFVLLLISYFLIFQSIWNVQKEYDHVSKTYKIESKIAELNNAIIEAETSVRGYYVTGDPGFVTAYRENIDKFAPVYEELKDLSISDVSQVSRLDTIKRLIDRRVEIMKFNISSFEGAGKKITKDMDSATIMTKLLMDSLKIYVGDFTSHVETAIGERKTKLTSIFTTAQMMIAISLLTAILSIFYSLFTYNRERLARNKSTLKNVQYQRELENKIEELKKMDAEVRELKSMEKFTATGRIARTIAHEVRNPLTNISLAAEQLQEMSGKSEESSMLLELINRNSLRINQLVADLLNATKLLELNIQKANINSLLDESLEMATDRINLHNIKVRKDYSDELCGVAVDSEKIKIAFLNIIVNAIEAMEKNSGILKVSTKKVGGKCVVEIEDNGTGMDGDTLQKLFEPYFTGKPKGNGLGLTNSQNIIISHRGKIEIDSRPGKGTSFKILLEL